MADYDGTESADIQALAAQMLGLNDGSNPEYYEEDDDDEPQVGHPAWQEILNAVPEEYRDAVIPTLQRWDSGVSRRFQSIHNEYEPYKELEEMGSPDDLKTAMEVYQALINDPAGTVDAVRRAYGLSLDDDDEEDDELDELPSALRKRLSKLDEHDMVLASMARQLTEAQEAEAEAAEDQELEDYLEELAEEYGDFDEDYIVGLIAAGVDGEEAVARWQQLTGQYEEEESYLPRVMSGSGGIPNASAPDVTRLSNSDTQDLVAEILRLSSSE